MVGKTEKIILGILIVIFIGMSGVLITALSTNNKIQENKVSKQLETSPQQTIQITNSVPQRETEEDDSIDIPISGTALERASAAALKYIGEGRVTDTEIDDEEGYYEIEITLGNGNEVDVHLDENFKVLSTEYEDEEDDDWLIKFNFFNLIIQLLIYII